MTPYLHPHLPNDPKEKKLRYHWQEIMTDITSTADTLVSQVTPLLGIMPRESTQLQSTNTPEDIKEILGTRAFQRYVDTPIQTLDGIVVNQPKHFLLLAQGTKKIAEEIRIEKINDLPGDIIDILERLGKADHIPHNQLYYIVENCADHYYSKVIETFVVLLKWQFADRQLLLVNTAKFITNLLSGTLLTCKQHIP